MSTTSSGIWRVWQDKLQNPRWRRWAGNLGFVALLVVIFFGVRFWQQQTLVEGAAPALRATLLGGNTFDLATERENPVQVYFWATWCGVCKLEQGSIESVAADHRVVGVAMHSGTDADVQKYLRENNLKVAVINDPDGTIARQWGVRATPTSFIIDREGRIRYREVGFTTELGMRLRLWLASR